MEKIMKIVIALIAVGFFFSLALAGDPYLDEGFKQYEEEYWAGFDKCLQVKSTLQRTACEKKLDQKMASDPRNRRSNAYFEMHYASLDFQLLEERLFELKVRQKNAPSFVMARSRPHGVVSKKMLTSEISRIQGLQNERRQGMACDQEKKSIEGLQYSLDSLSSACKQYFVEKKVAEKLNARSEE